MDTSGIDLNLLVTLDALLAERNVTHAAERLHLSQPAISARLARLRELFGDPLLIPAQRGMVPTQRALELQHPLHAALEGVRQVVAGQSTFDPRQFEGTVAIAASDYVQYALLVPLAIALSVDAPRIRMAWRTLDVSTLIGQMERGEIDLAIMAPDSAPDQLRMKLLYREDYVVIARADHPRVQGKLDLDLFCSLDHIIVSPQGGGFEGPTDVVLQGIGHQRRVTLSSPGFLVVPQIVARSDAVALVPARIARSGPNLQVLPPPIHVPGFDIAMIWHDRTTTHPAQRWLREKVEETTQVDGPPRGATGL